MARSHTHSQHFLRSPRLVAELIGHSNIRKNDMVFDLGAGSGVISSVLARRCKRVFAVEVEPEALKKLRQNLKDAANITIIEQDILSVEIPNNSYKIFANIPFSISSEIVRKFTRSSNPPKSMYIIAQKQFARKLVPGDDHFTSQLSAEIAPWFTVRIRKPLKKTDFTPPPAVDTVLLEIKPREQPFLEHRDMMPFIALVEKCFTNQKYFASLHRPFSPSLRPSEVNVKQWVELFGSTRKS